jgi:hypothetical protein
MHQRLLLVQPCQDQDQQRHNYYYHLVVYNFRFDGDNNVIADNEDDAPVRCFIVNSAFIIVV